MIVWHALLHAGEETLRLLPFLYLTYLLMEWIEHRAGERVEGMIRSAGRFGPLVGGALGVLPQCGFSAAAAGLYAGRVVTLGTLIAAFLSTSDEMLPILLSGGLPAPSVFLLVAIKAGIAIIVGFAVDFILRRRRGESIHAHEGVDELCRENNRRQEIENKILEEAIDMIENDPINSNRNAIVLWKEDWHY